MVDWTAYDDAYGPADGTGALLARAEQVGPWDELWNEVWGRLCHQGTVYTASYAAIPTLTEIATRARPAGYNPALHLAAAILSSLDGPRDPQSVRRRYAREISVLRDLAERNLAYAELDADFVYGVQAVLAFEDAGVWQRNLEAIVDGELQLECPACAEGLLLSLETFTLTTWAGDPPTPVNPGDARGSRLLALTAHHPIARQIPYLVGRATCPACNHPFDVPNALS